MLRRPVNAVFGGAPGGAATPGSAAAKGSATELLDELSRVKVVHWEPAPIGRAIPAE